MRGKPVKRKEKPSALAAPRAFHIEAVLKSTGGCAARPRAARLPRP